MLGESQHPACGEGAAAQNNRDTKSVRRRTVQLFAAKPTGATPLCVPLWDDTVCSYVCGCPGVRSLTALLLKRSNDSPGQDMFDETSADKEYRKMQHPAQDRQSS